MKKELKLKHVRVPRVDRECRVRDVFWRER
jgi:hypothetical protein